MRTSTFTGRLALAAIRFLVLIAISFSLFTQRRRRLRRRASMTTIRLPANQSRRMRRTPSPIRSSSCTNRCTTCSSSPAQTPSGRRAQNINTIDEVPDSSWFTNRIGTTRVTAEELARGPNVGAPPDPSKWIVIREKTSGVHPGFTARDAKGRDMVPRSSIRRTFAEGATASVEIATKIFWAFGYNQVESYLTTFDPKRVEFDPAATLRRPSGQRTPFTWDDINQILERVARRPDGTYRIVAGRLVPGKILGNFLYSGTRPDDPNDIVPHEHRRELRALRVFGAWTNLTDWKAANTLDALATQNGRTVVKHYLQDVGSTFGLNNDLHEWDLSYEHFYQGDSTRKALLLLRVCAEPVANDRLRRVPLHR